jgi:3-(3-hydroxy-phenyl)propionate hydroxylase
MTEGSPTSGRSPTGHADHAGPQVLVVGGGPTGLAAANLLGALGVRVLLVERHEGTSDEAKAISLDDESLRSLQLAGLASSIYPIIVPGTGTRYYGSKGQELVHARGSESYRFGHPFKNPFAQPEFERVLRAGLTRFPNVQERFGISVVDLAQKDEFVRASLQATTWTVSTGEGPVEEVDVEFVLGCDGGRSTVREVLGVPMTGRGFDDVWLVVDTLEDGHDQRYGMHHGDPDRPHVIVPGRDGRCRYEFRLQPGEGRAGEAPPFDLLQRLLKPYRELRPEQVERAVNYRFNALLADRLREGRCFLLGDAAHMMPPFAGQGLNSGLRDAANLCWKIAEVLSGSARDALLDTYESERRPHARAVIDLSVRLGDIVMTTDRRRAQVRDLLVSMVMRTRPGRRYLTEMRYRPSISLREGVVVQSGRGCNLTGTPLPQPMVLTGAGHQRVPLDEVLGQGWSVLGVGVAPADWQACDQAALRGTRVDVAVDDRAAREQDGRKAVTDADGRLDQLLRSARGRFVLVRPDRIVAAVFDVAASAQVAAALEPLIGTLPTAPAVTSTTKDHP